MNLDRTSTFNVPAHLGILLAKNKRALVLRGLDRLIGADYGLFRRDEKLLQARQAAIQFKIDLLLEWGRYPEALAWLCLETEVNPQNVLAQAMKLHFKRQFHLDDFEGNRADPKRDPEGVGAAWAIDWAGIAGMRELKLTLERDIIVPHLEPAIYEQYRVPLPNGILFYGPPGCGKTFVARHLAKIVNCTFLDLKPSDLASIYVHGTQEKIGQTFKEAQEHAPAIIFFDEIDAFIPSRSEGLYQAYSAEVNEFLAQMNDCRKRGILVIGATNYLGRVDVAVRRPGRFDKKIYVGPPDVEARMEALKLYMSDRPQEEIDYCSLIANKELYSYADLELIVNEAARNALAQRKAITARHLAEAFESIRPSITEKMIDEMGRE